MRFEYDYDARFTTYKQEGGKGYATLTFLPGNAAIGLMHGVYVPPADRGKGIGTKQHKERLDLVRANFGDSISHLACTVSNHNEAEIKILERFGWEPVYDFGDASLWIKKMSEADQPVTIDAEDVED